MADPATQFQPGGLGIGYNFTPTTYHPANIEVPTGAGALWAQVGKTAMDAVAQAGSMLQQSPLNPAVRANMDAQIQAARSGIAQTKAMENLPNNLGRLVMGVDAQGHLILKAPAEITDPTLANAFQSAFGGIVPGQQKKEGHEPPPINTGRSGGGGGDQGENQGFEAKEYPATTQPTQPTQQPKEKGGPPTTGEMSRGSASTDNDFALRQMIQSRGSAAAQEGTPASMTFLNPATGNVEPQQTPSVFASKAAAPAPPAPDQAPQPAQSQTPAAATQADQAAMAKWQAQNAHPVMSSQNALAWMKNQTTLAQDATYLPMGGPNGEPAYAFHMKGGGMNTVPISQMIQKGAGPMVAAQNTSAVISQTDQAQQPGIPSGTGAGAPQPIAATPGPIAPPAPGLASMPSGTGAGAPQPVAATPGPPAAPGMTDIYGNPLGSYTNVASKGGLTPDQLTAQTTGAGQPAIQVTPAVPNLSQADKDTLQTQADKLGEPTGEYKGDRLVEGTTGPYRYYRDDNPGSPSRGRVYTVLPGPAGHYYEQQHWYPGTNTYTNYELPDSAAHQQMWDKWGVTGFLPRSKIDGMTAQEMEPWLQRAWQVEHLQNSPIDQGTNLTLDAAEQIYKNFKQISDIQQTLAKNGYPALSSADALNANLEGGAEAVESRRPYNQQAWTQRAGTQAGNVMGKAAGMDRDSALAIRTLEQLVDQTKGLYAKYPALFGPGKTEGVQLPNVHGEAVNIETANIKPSTVLDDVFSGQDLDTKLTNQKNLQTSLGTRYNSLVDGQHQMLYRVVDKHDSNSLKAAQGMDLDDKTNQYKDHVMPRSKITTLADAEARMKLMDDQIAELKKQLPTPTPSPSLSPPTGTGTFTASRSASASPTPTLPTVQSQDAKALDKFLQENKPGTEFTDENGNTYRIKQPKK